VRTRRRLSSNAGRYPRNRPRPGFITRAAPTRPRRLLPKRNPSPGKRRLRRRCGYRRQAGQRRPPRPGPPSRWPPLPLRTGEPGYRSCGAGPQPTPRPTSPGCRPRGGLPAFSQPMA
jgi:hypothetical protein